MKLTKTQKLLWIQGALAAVMFSLTTGNFISGYMTELGASPALIARLVAIPQLGCLLELVAPFYFERKSHRKASTVTLLFLFRFSVGFAGLAPAFLGSAEARIRFVVGIYIFSFLVAGFVTGPNDQWIQQIAPPGFRGRYFSIKDILALIANSTVALIMGRVVDRTIANGQPLRGYMIVYVFCIVGALVDLGLMLNMEEKENISKDDYSLRDLLQPLRDRHFMPIVLYMVISNCAVLFSQGFVYTYQLRALGLSHTFITTCGFIAAASGMLFMWIWGNMSDRFYWKFTVLGTSLVSVLVMLGWCFMPAGLARYLSPVLIILNTGGIAASLTSQNALLYDHSPGGGQTAYIGLNGALACGSAFFSALAGSLVQSALAPRLGLQGSMAVTFAITALILALDFIYGLKILPNAPMEWDEDRKGL